MYYTTPEQEDELDARWLFSRISSQLRREISWADFADQRIPYQLTRLGFAEATALRLTDLAEIIEDEGRG